MSFDNYFLIKIKLILECILGKYVFLIGYVILLYIVIDNGWCVFGKKKLKMDNDMWECVFREMSEIRRFLDFVEKRRLL